MKIITSILFILCIESASLYKYSDRSLNTFPVQYAMLRDISLDGILDTKNMLIAEAMNRKVKFYLGTTKTSSEEDDVSYHLDMVEHFLNNNYVNMKKLQRALIKEIPQIRNVFKINARGFTCDQELCDLYGDGHYAIGICTPYSCVCNDFTPEGNTCENGLYYDPTYGICDIPTNIKICGF